MPSSIRILNPGDSTLFTTQVAGQPPTLLIFGPTLEPDAFLPTISWRKILCCEDDHVARNGGRISIPTAGELLQVTNISAPGVRARVYTDYI